MGSSLRQQLPHIIPFITLIKGCGGTYVRLTWYFNTIRNTHIVINQRNNNVINK